MKLARPLGWSAALCLAAMALQAQEANQLDKFNQQLKQLQADFERQQREMRERFEKLVREQQAQIDALKKQLEAGRTNAPSAIVPRPTAATDSSQTLPPQQVTLGVPPPPASSKPWSPSDPIHLAGGQRNYLNLSFDGLFAAGASTAKDIESLELGGHDPKQRGFTVQNLETVFEGKVDPYFRGQANVILQIDPQGETALEAEEAYLETMSLPGNLQVKAGQFFTEFGRLNPMHPHTWDFVDQPLVNGRFLGEDGLRSAGARVSWLTPTPFYSELFLTVANSQGGTAFSFRNDTEGGLFFQRPHTQERVKGPADMLFVPRYAASFNLSDSQTLVAGTSAAFGPNSSGTGADTQIYGVDLFWKWKSPRQHAGFPFVTWQTEAMLRRYQAGEFTNAGDDLNGNGAIDAGEADIFGDAAIHALPRETLTDYGFYSQVAYGIRKGWVAALRGEYLFPEQKGLYEDLVSPDPDRASRWRISPNLTYYPSEFSKIRLQYNYDHRNGIGEDHSVWVQFEFLLGSHAAHKF
ncbi:MAG: hypothetical protein HY674_13585 [Chloroflexi bacterium]|nr:hypothetical protein [Chloroflexota bacterium]